MGSQCLKEVCVNNIGLRRYIRGRAVLLWRRYRSPFTEDDIENEFWAALFSAIDSRYSPEKDIIVFARSVVFSCYGNWLPGYRYPNFLLRECNRFSETLGGMVSEVEQPGTAFTDVIDAQDTIDAIERNLEKRYTQGRTYQLALEQFRFLRAGGEMQEFANQVKVSKTRAYQILKVTRKCSQQFQCKEAV